jgi:hypothetical protein
VRDCIKCGETKSLREFYQRGDGKLMGSCKQCHCATTSHREQPALRSPGEHGGRALTAAELVVCPKCSLRGPHECITPRSLGLGQQGWV